MNVLEKILEEIRDNAKLGNMRLESIRIEKVEEIIRSHMDEVDDGWIPVDERLPEEKMDCLITVKYTGFMGMHDVWIKTGHLEFGNEWYGDCIGGEAIAWQPLPEPYKPKN